MFKTRHKGVEAISLKCRYEYHAHLWLPIYRAHLCMTALLSCPPMHDDYRPMFICSCLKSAPGLHVCMCHSLCMNALSIVPTYVWADVNAAAWGQHKGCMCEMCHTASAWLPFLSCPPLHDCPSIVPTYAWANVNAAAWGQHKGCMCHTASAWLPVCVWGCLCSSIPCYTPREVNAHFKIEYNGQIQCFASLTEQMHSLLYTL